MSIRGLVARVRSLSRGLRLRGAFEAEMAEEFRLHQELRAADLVREGLAPAEAARQARLDFGCAELHKDAARAARGLGPIDEIRISWLDVKLGGRMLVRYPGLTIVGGLAMAFAIAIGAAGFELITQIAAPSVPLPGGDRIVAVRAWNAESNDGERRLAHDFTTWRGALRSVVDLGAYRAVGRNLLVPGGEVAPVSVAEISASAFRVAAVPPLLGRALVAADEQPGAPPVLVIGYDAWRTHFAGDARVVGRAVRLDGVPYTVVGVMPEGFAFPSSYAWWAPLRLDPSGYAPGDGPAIELFGRLASGATLDAAQAELTALGRRAAADFPRERARVRPEVVPLGESLFTARVGLTLRAAIEAANVPLVLFLVLVCGNVAMLTFARAATRENELVMRTALGASRGRLVVQLFAESLVLGALSAVLGLAAAGVIVRVGMAAADGPTGALPFWIRPRLSAMTVLYAAALTVLGAVIAGVVPAMKVTRGLVARLRAASAGGGGLRFGGVWTAVIVSQVTVTVAFPVLALAAWRSTVRQRALESSFAAGQYVMASVEMNPVGALGQAADTSAAARARLRAARAELVRRAAADPAVRGVTTASVMPLMYHPWRRVEVEGIAPAVADSAAVPRVSSARVVDDFFAVFGTPVLAGRGFTSADAAGESRVVVVNQSFVREILGGRNPIGRRVRYTAFEETAGRRSPDDAPEPWYEIVGVVPDLGMKAAGDARVAAGLYHPAAPTDDALSYLAVRVRGDVASLAPRLRELAAAVDPTLRLDTVLPMDEIQAGDLRMEGYMFRVFVVVSALALTLSLAGIYAVTSFTVARRTREIGVRVALGADPRRVAASILRRPLAQVGLGVVLGCAMLALLQHATSADGLSLRAGAGVLAYGVTLFAVCLLACVVPVRRALAVEPTEALRADG
jgi:predicted permease